MILHNKEMVNFIDLSIIAFAVSFLYNIAAMRILQINTVGVPSEPGKYKTCVTWVGYLILLARIAIAGYGIHFSWTEE